MLPRLFERSLFGDDGDAAGDLCRVDNPLLSRTLSIEVHVLSRETVMPVLLRLDACFFRFGKAGFLNHFEEAVFGALCRVGNPV